MPLWKQRMLARLMKPADDEGGDLGGTATETPTAEEAPAQGDAAQAAEEPAAGESQASDDELPTDKPQSSKMLALLDELSDSKPATPAAEAPAVAETPAADPAAAEPAADPAQPKTAEQEEAELLEGVKSERGRERIKSVFAERKQLEADITEFRDLVKSTGMSPQEFAQTLEFGRLVNSGDEKNIRVALEMIEGQRAMLYQKLGIEAPGVDLLAGHDDLKQAVDNMEITRDRAVELAKYRKVEATKTAQAQRATEAAQSQEQFRQTVATASQQMEAYLETRKNEVDHQARMKVLGEHFKNPANLQTFVQTYQPSQWMPTLKMMYDGIVVQKAPTAAPTPQPLRSRPVQLGNPAPQGDSPMNRLAQHIDNLGL